MWPDFARFLYTMYRNNAHRLVTHTIVDRLDIYNQIIQKKLFS